MYTYIYVQDRNVACHKGTHLEVVPVGSSDSSRDLNIKKYHFRKSGKLLSQHVF